MKNTTKKTETRSFETKLSPDKVISTAVRFFSLKEDYKVQAQSSDWIIFEATKRGADYWRREETMGAVMALIGSILIITLIGALPGIFLLLGGTFTAIHAHRHQRLPQNITIATEKSSTGIQVRIESPSRKEIKVLVGELISQLTV